MDTIVEYKAIVIGGSAGSFQSILEILEYLPKKYSIPLFITLHRLKQDRTGLVESVSFKSRLPISEPYDNDKIEAPMVYFAPSNYHMLIEKDNTISLSTEELVEYSRPSIDVMFKSAAMAYGKHVIGILLSGANKDGAQGLKDIQDAGGTTIIQDPRDAEVTIMPQSAIDHMSPDFICSVKQIIGLLQKL